MSLIIAFIVAFFATAAFAVLFNIPKKQWFFCGLTGAIGWVFYTVMEASYDIIAATFTATLVLTLIARIFSVLRRSPVTLFLVSGIFPLVPGVGIYYTSYYFILGDLSLAVAKGIETLKIAVAIALGIVFVLSLPQSMFQRSVIKSTKE